MKVGFFLMAILLLGIMACTRSLPPDVPEFKAPAAKVTEQVKPELTVAKIDPGPIPNSSPPPPAKAPTSAPAPTAAAPPTAAPQPAKTPTRSLIGTWSVTEMSHNGQSQPMPAGMSISLTFSEGGSISMNMSGAPGGAGGSQQGTYTLNDSQITMTISNDTKSGTLTFESDNRAVLDMQGTRMVLTR